MSIVDDAEKLVAHMSREEKAQLMRTIARDIGDAVPGIESTPGVCGGSARIRQARIPIWLLEQLRRLGVTESRMLYEYPSLNAEDLVNAWAYVRHHPEEIDQEIETNESA